MKKNEGEETLMNERIERNFIAIKPEIAEKKLEYGIQYLPVDSLKSFMRNDECLPIKENEKQILFHSIKLEGTIRVNLVVNKKTNEVICGNGRLAAAKELGIKMVPCMVIDFANEKEALGYAIRDNLQRRQMNPFEKYLLQNKLDALEEGNELHIEKAIIKPQPNETSKEKNKRYRENTTIAKKAKEIGISDKQYDKIRKLDKLADDNIKKKLIAGDLTVNQAYKLYYSNKKKEQIDRGGDEVPSLIRQYDYWHFDNFDGRFGKEGYPGRIPGQIPANIIYYYSKIGDTVLDPMAGSGTTIDVAQFMQRKWLAYDINPVRPEIIKRNVIEEGLPTDIEPVSLIISDPPYYDMLDKRYEEGSISRLSLAGFYKAIDKLMQECAKILKDRGYVALIMQNYNIEPDPYGVESYDIVFECHKIMSKYFRFIHRISCPALINKKPWDMKQAKVKRQMVGKVRDVLVFRKIVE